MTTAPGTRQTNRAVAPTVILLVRHGEVDNPRQVLYGRSPYFKLSARGREQAACVAAFLADRPVTAIYSSPLLRARQMADAIARRHPRATRHVSALLHEVRSAWQGTPLVDFAPGFSTYTDRRAADDESMEEIRERMARFLARARRRHPGQTVVAVSHGDPITILRVALSGRPLSLPAIRGADYADLCSVTEVTFEAAPAGRADEAPPRVAYRCAPALAGAPTAAGSAGG